MIISLLTPYCNWRLLGKQKSPALRINSAQCTSIFTWWFILVGCSMLIVLCIRLSIWMHICHALHSRCWSTIEKKWWIIFEIRNQLVIWCLTKYTTLFLQWKPVHNTILNYLVGFHQNQTNKRMEKKECQ